jgi:integrase
MASSSRSGRRTPSLRLHRASGRAVVTVRGRDFYCGKFGSPEAEQAYARVLASIRAHGAEVVQHHGVPSVGSKARRPTSPSSLTVAELLLAYVEDAERAYAPPSRELEPIKVVVRDLRKSFGSMFADEFGPLLLKELRQQWIDRGLRRAFINKKVKRAIRIWGWGVENELVSPDVWNSLRAVASLRSGRSAAKESDPVEGVSDRDVLVTLPHLPRPVRAIIELLHLTGARPGEIRVLRTCDIVRTEHPWQYNLSHHKNSHRGKKRVVFFGPKARAALEPFLNDDNPSAFLFSPRQTVSTMKESSKSTGRTDAQRERAASNKRRAAGRERKEKTGRTKPRSSRRPGEAYTRNSLSNAVRRACLKHGIPVWNPKQLRHACRTRLDELAGRGASAAAIGDAYASPEAQATLGHANWLMTQRYGSPALGVGAETMEKYG